MTYPSLSMQKWMKVAKLGFFGQGMAVESRRHGRRGIFPSQAGIMPMQCMPRFQACIRFKVSWCTQRLIKTMEAWRGKVSWLLGSETALLISLSIQAMSRKKSLSALDLGHGLFQTIFLDWYSCIIHNNELNDEPFELFYCSMTTLSIFVFSPWICMPAVHFFVYRVVFKTWSSKSCFVPFKATSRNGVLLLVSNSFQSFQLALFLFFHRVLLVSISFILLLLLYNIKQVYLPAWHLYPHSQL